MFNNGIAFHLFGFPVHYYGICIAVGFMMTLAILQWKKDYAKMTTDQIFDISFIAIFCGIVGARIFYVIQFWHEFSANPLMAFRIDKGGLVFYGGFILAVICLVTYSKIKKVSVPLMLDLFSPAIAMGHAFGRIGCFLQGCCYGKVCDAPFAVVYPQGSGPAHGHPDILSGNSLPLYPVQLFESAANFILCGILLLLLKRFKPGQVAGIYLMSYAILRFCTEFMRGDHKDSIAGLTPSQFIALVIMLPAGLALFIYFGKKKGETDEKAA